MEPVTILIGYMIVAGVARWLETTDTKAGRWLKADTQRAYVATVEERERTISLLAGQLHKARTHLDSNVLMWELEDRKRELAALQAYAHKHGLARVGAA